MGYANYGVFFLLDVLQWCHRLWHFFTMVSSCFFLNAHELTDAFLYLKKDTTARMSDTAGVTLVYYASKSLMSMPLYVITCVIIAIMVFQIPLKYFFILI